MYLISIIAIILLICLGLIHSMDFSSMVTIGYLIDFPSLILLLIICIPFLVSSGLIKDFNNAFRIALSRKKNVSLNELKRAIEALTLTIKTLLGSGFLIFLMSMLIILHTLDTPESLGPKLSVALIAFIYACVFALPLLPLRSILKLRIIEYMSEPEITSENDNSLSENSSN